MPSYYDLIHYGTIVHKRDYLINNKYVTNVYITYKGNETDKYNVPIYRVIMVDGAVIEIQLI